MKKKILINAVHAEEKRVAIMEGDTLVDFYVEVASREHLKGNIYKGVVTRIEPAIQAVFVDFGSKKDGFLQIREVMPSYFQRREEGKRIKVQEVLSKGQELIVQVEKDERDTKGASLTTYLSLAGRYIVMMPGQERVGVSRKIESQEDRDRLKDLFTTLKPPENMGFILRTAGIDRSKQELSADLKYLTKLWHKIESEGEKASAPALIYREQDMAVRTVRDYLTSEVVEVLVDDEDALKNVKDFLKKTLPWRKINVKHYKEKRPLFSKHGIEEQIAKINERYLYLPSRGYIVFDKTEALTAIDVNSGRSRKDESVESTALRTNLEAAEEIARQLRLRDIGGLVVIDFIDMESSKNRREVETRLKDAMSADKAHSETTGISKFGILEMTRERMRPPYLESILRKCEVCGGAGVVRTDEMVAISLLRDIQTRASKGGMKGLHCTVPVGSMNFLVNTKREDLALTEKESGVKITLTADATQLSGQYKIEEEKGEEVQAEEPEKKAEDKGKEEQPAKKKHYRKHRRYGKHAKRQNSEKHEKADSVETVLQSETPE
ncbi:MAG TPA: Rne/Rng family ribonuclease, partial [Thermodesulfovibrionales bacterium]|nr:Rne/Rng family ribonuclease [Thermodesulfovibrionales bacterium]